MAAQYDNAVELDKLIHNCEFENQQYVKLIEKETELTEKYKQEVQNKKDEAVRLHQEISRLDEETKHFHRQFVLNRDNCESQKKTSEVLSAHVNAMVSKMEMTVSKRRMDREEKEKILQRYRDTWCRYESVYKNLPLAQELETCKQVERDLELKHKQLAERRDHLQGQLGLYNGKPAIERCSLQTFIIKLAELYVGMMKKKAEYERKWVEWSENDARIKQLMELQEGRERTEEEQRRNEQNQENTMQKLTEMQIREPHKQQLGTNKQQLGTNNQQLGTNNQQLGANNSAMQTEQPDIDSPMISVFSEKDDTDEAMQTDLAPHRPQTEVSDMGGARPPPQSWIANYQTQQQALKDQSNQYQKATFNASEQNPVSSNVTQSERCQRPHVAVVSTHSLQPPYVAFSKANNAYSEPSVSIHLQAPSSSHQPLTPGSPIATNASPLQIHQPIQAATNPATSKFIVQSVKPDCATQYRLSSPLQIKHPPTIPQLVINSNNSNLLSANISGGATSLSQSVVNSSNNNSNVLSTNFSGGTPSLSQQSAVTRGYTQVNSQIPLVNQQNQATKPQIVQNWQGPPMQNTPNLFVPSRMRTGTASTFAIHMPVGPRSAQTGSTGNYPQRSPMSQPASLTVPGSSFPQAKHQRPSVPVPNVQVQKQTPIPRPQIQTSTSHTEYPPFTHSSLQIPSATPAAVHMSKIPVKILTSQEPGKVLNPPLKRPHPSPIPDQRSAPANTGSLTASAGHIVNISPMITSMINKLSSPTHAGVRQELSVASPTECDVLSPTNLKPKTPEHQKTVPADTRSPFSLERHMEKLKAINKSPSEPIYANRRMFANQLQAVNSPAVTAAGMFGGGGGQLNNNSPLGRFAAPQKHDIPMETFTGGQPANPASVTMYGDGHHLSSQKPAYQNTTAIHQVGNKTGELSSLLAFSHAPTASTGMFPFGGGNQYVNSPGRVTSKNLATPMNFFSSVASPEAPNGGMMFNFAGQKTPPATNNLLSLFGDDEGDQQEETGFNFRYGSTSDEPASPQGGFSMF